MVLEHQRLALHPLRLQRQQAGAFLDARVEQPGNRGQDEQGHEGEHQAGIARRSHAGALAGGDAGHGSSRPGGGGIRVIAG